MFLYDASIQANLIGIFTILFALTIPIIMTIGIFKICNNFFDRNKNKKAKQNFKTGLYMLIITFITSIVSEVIVKMYEKNTNIPLFCGDKLYSFTPGERMIRAFISGLRPIWSLVSIFPLALLLLAIIVNLIKLLQKKESTDVFFKKIGFNIIITIVLFVIIKLVNFILEPITLDVPTTCPFIM